MSVSLQLLAALATPVSMVVCAVSRPVDSAVTASPVLLDRLVNQVRGYRRLQLQEEAVGEA